MYEFFLTRRLYFSVRIVEMYFIFLSWEKMEIPLCYIVSMPALVHILKC